MRIRVAEENCFFHKVWRKGCRYREMFPYPACCIYASKGLLVDTDWVEVENCNFFEEFLFTRVPDWKGVQLVKESFLDLIYVPWIEIFNSFTACNWMSLQIECSVEKSVTIRTTKRLENGKNVVHVAYVVVASQQSHSIFALLYTSPSKFTGNVAIHNIYIIQQNSLS